MLHFASLTNIRQGAKQDTRVHLQVTNNLIKLNLSKDTPRLMLISRKEIGQKVEMAIGLNDDVI